MVSSPHLHNPLFCTLPLIPGPCPTARRREPASPRPSTGGGPGVRGFLPRAGGGVRGEGIPDLGSHSPRKLRHDSVAHAGTRRGTGPCAPTSSNATPPRGRYLPCLLSQPVFLLQVAPPNEPFPQMPRTPYRRLNHAAVCQHTVGRSFMLTSPGSALCTNGTALTAIAAVAVSPWTPRMCALTG